MSWPTDIPKAEFVKEELIFILTNTEVDLANLADPSKLSFKRSKPVSDLEKLFGRISTGGHRNVESDKASEGIKYDILYIPFSMKPLPQEKFSVKLASDTTNDSGYQSEGLPIPAGSLPEPEDVKEWTGLPRLPPSLEPTEKGTVGGVVRLVKRVPLCVWVINEHSEEITVVVSQYAPNRILGSVGASYPTAGGAFGFNTTTFLSPATKKTLAPRSQDREGSIAVFPLWKAKCAFAVISVFKGPEKVPYIEGDRVPVASTAYFVNKPNLKLVGYDGKLLTQDPPQTLNQT
ncbi:hypothetical protein GP486_007994, partial [Trichoglossum hirsutum]